MADYLSMNRDELTAEKAALEAQYKKFQDMGLKLEHRPAASPALTRWIWRWIC